MALQYGMNILASDMRNILEQNDRQQSGVRTWRQLFGNASLANQAQVDALKGNYADTITQAYKANLAQRNAILGAGLSAGSTQQMLQANKQNLHNTYQQYIQGYSSDASALAQNYGQEISAIDTALNERAKNLSNLYGSAYKYLANRLATATMSRDLIDKPLYDEDENFTGYEQETLNYLDEYKMDWLRDEQGNLLSWNQISNQLLNPDGSLNARGTEFFDKMFNATPQGYLDEEGNRVESFDEWLTNENSDLRDWAIGQDVFNYNLAGTNIGTAKVHAGLESTDTTGTHHDYVTDDDVRSTVGAKMSSFDMLSRNLTVAGDKLNDTIEKLQTYRHDKPKPAKNEHRYAGSSKGVSAESKARADYQEFAREYEKAWKDYSSQLDTIKSDVFTELKNVLGSDAYNTFVENEISFEKEYESLIDKLSKATDYDKASITALNKLLNDFVKRAQNFADAHKNTEKRSGY